MAKEKAEHDTQKDQKKELMSNFQIEVLMSTEKVEKMVADIDEDQNEF
jgi:nitrogen regulatory protein PII